MNDEERPDWPDNATQEDMEEIERTEDRLNLLSRIDRAMGIARKKESPRITQWLEKSRQLLERPEFAVVSGWIALEIFGVKVIVRGLFLGMASPFEELAEWMRGRVFGGNGSIDKLRDLLKKSPTMNDAIEDDLWQQLRFVQKMRNGIVHGGITVDVKDARNALETIRAVVDKFDTALGSVETEPSS